MKSVAIQDNLSKTKAVQDVYQQMLRFPDEVQESLAGQLQEKQRLRERSVNKSEETEKNKLRAKKRSKKQREVSGLGRREDDKEPSEEPEEERQCSIDLRV